MAVENKEQESDTFSLPNISKLTENSLEKRSRKQKMIIVILFILSSLTIIILGATIVIMVQYSENLYNYPDVLREMFSTVRFDPGDSFAEVGNYWGITSMIWGTLYIGVVALIFAMIFGIGSAIFMSEYMSKKWARRLQPILEFMAAIPSIILGLLAITTFGKVLTWLFYRDWFVDFTASLGWNSGDGLIATSPFSKLNTAIMVAILATPIIATISYDAMQSTPAVQRQAAKAFGATKHEVLLTVVLPHASKSMFAAVLLGFGRVIGETIVATVVLGSNPIIDYDPFVNGITLTSAIVTFLPEASAGSDLRDVLFFMGLILLVMSFIVVALAEAIANSNKYVMGVVNLFWIPLRWVKDRIVNFFNQFTTVKELNAEQVLANQPGRYRKNRFLQIVTGLLTGVFIIGVFILLSSLIFDTYDYLTLDGTIGSFFERLYTLLFKRYSVFIKDQGMYAIGPAIIGSISVILVASVLAFPISTATAIYLYEFERDSRFSEIIRQAIINISAMPSIVVGIFVVAAFSVGLNMRIGLLPGGIALGIMMIPIVTTNAIEALRNIPETHKESALALGATKWEAFRNHRFPYALPSIVTGYVLGLARVIGETAPILFTVAAITGTTYPTRLTDQGLRMLPFEIWLNLKVIKPPGPNGENIGPLIASTIAFILLLIVALMNVAAYRLRRRWRARFEYNGEL